MTDLVLTAMERSVDLFVVFLIGNITYLLNFRALGPIHGLEEAPVVNQPALDYLGEGG